MELLKISVFIYLFGFTIGYHCESTASYNTDSGTTYEYCSIRRDHTLTWSGAQVACQSLGYELVVISDSDEQSFIASNLNYLFNRHPMKRFWIGLSVDTKSDCLNNDWTWYDYTPYSYSQWKASVAKRCRFPDRYPYGCAYVIIKTGQWANGKCSHKHNVLCEKIIETSDSCVSTPCLNGGTCVNSLSGYTCDCNSGFSGVVCQMILPPPLCPPGYTGTWCETRCAVGPTQSIGQPYGSSFTHYSYWLAYGTVGYYISGLGTSNGIYSIPVPVHMYINYGNNSNWNVTWALMGERTDPTIVDDTTYAWTTDYVVQAEAQFSNAGVPGGPLVLCNIRFMTNLGVIMRRVGPYPCPYASTETYEVVLPDGLGYFSGYESNYGIHEINFWEQCNSPSYDYCATAQCDNGGTCFNNFPAQTYGCACTEAYSGTWCQLDCYVKSTYVGEPYGNAFFHDVIWETYGDFAIYMYELSTVSNRYSTPLATLFYVNYGLVSNWNPNASTWAHMGANSDTTKVLNPTAYHTTNYVVKVETQFTRANIAGGPLVLCSMRFTTNLGTVLPWAGPSPCPYSDVQSYTAVLPNGLIHFNGFQSNYGIHQLEYVQKCVDPSINYCSSNPCNNGGSCYNNFPAQSFGCFCPPSYTDAWCNTYV